MSRFGKVGIVLTTIIFAALVHGTAYAAASATIGAFGLGSSVPIGSRVTFTVVTSGFTNPTFYLRDSFPGGATTVNIDSSGDFSWTPNKDDIGQHTFTITVSDTLGDSATVSQSVSVSRPTVSIQAITPSSAVTVGVPVSFSLSTAGFIEPAYAVADSFSFSSMRAGALSQSGAFSWTPITQDIGTHAITVTATDSYENTATDTAQITVLPAPSVSILTLAPGRTVGIGQALTFVATSTGFIDPSYTVSDGFTYNGSSTMTISSAGKASWTPVLADTGVHQFVITATDLGGRTAKALLAITVTQQQAVPVQETAPTAPPVSPAAPAVAPTAPVAPTPKPAPQTPKTLKPAAAPAFAPSTAVVTATSTTEPVFTSTGTTSTDAQMAVSTDTVLAFPSLPPTQSFVQYLLSSFIGFFASIPKFFR